MKLRHVFICLLCMATSLTSNGRSIDSLKHVFHSLPQGIDRHKVAIQILQYFDDIQSPIDSVIRYTDNFETFVENHPQHELALETKYHILVSHYRKDSILFFKEAEELIHDAYNKRDYEVLGKTAVLMGGKYRLMSGFVQGLEKLESGLRLMETSTDSVSLYYQARITSLISSLNSSQGNFLTALKYGLHTQELADSISDETLKLRSYFNLGAIYGNLASDEKKLSPKADRIGYRELELKYHELAYDFCKDKEVNRHKGIATYNLGLHYSMNDQFEKSKAFMYEAISIGKALPWAELLFNAYDVLSADLMDTNELDSGYYYILQADDLAKKMNSPYHQLSSHYNLGLYHKSKSNFNEARRYILKALELAREHKITAKERVGYEMLYELEKEAGNFEGALSYYTDLNILTDSLSGKAHLSEINKLKVQFDHAQQKAEIENLKKDAILQKRRIERKNGFIMFSILAGLFFSAIIYFLYREKTLRSQKRELAAQQKLLRTQLNPHFLFNALNSIQQYIYLQKEPKLVADYLAKFSRLTRRILQNSNQDLIALSEEIDFLKDYMDLQKLRFDEPFEYTIEVDEELLDDEVKIPPMFTQPFIENSIEHGILNKISKGQIDIRIEKEGDQVAIELKDNGIGINKAVFEKKNAAHRSLAIGITRDRLKALDKKLRKKTDLIITDLAGLDETITGTKVVLKLPILY